MSTGIRRAGQLAALVLMLLPGLPAAQQADESVLERIERTGVMRAGTREGLPPFAFRGEDGAFDGFSVDLIRAIHAEVDRMLEGRTIELEIQPVSSGNRIEKILNREIDIECGLTTATWRRERQVDFTLTFFFNGTRILTRRENANKGLPAIERGRIGVARDSTTEQVIAETLPDAIVVPVPSMDIGMQMLQEGRIDGLSNIATALQGLMNASEMRGQLSLLPRIGQLNQEPMACMVPENDSDWRDTVNGVMLELLDGVEEYRGGYYEIYEKWFGRSGQLHYPLNKEAIEHFRNIKAWIQD